MALFDGVPAPQYVLPSEDARRNMASGAQLAQPFVQSFLQARQLGERRREFDLEQPLRDAQLTRQTADIALAEARLKGVEAQAALEVIGAGNAIKAQGKMVEAFGIEATFDGDYSPAKRVTFLQFLAKNPELAGTPWAANVARSFDTAQQLEGRIELEGERQRMMQLRAIEIQRLQNERASEVAGVRADSAKEVAEIRGQNTADSKAAAADARIFDPVFKQALESNPEDVAGATAKAQTAVRQSKLPRFESESAAQDWAETHKDKALPAMVKMKMKVPDLKNKGQFIEEMKWLEMIPVPSSVVGMDEAKKNAAEINERSRKEEELRQEKLRRSKARKAAGESRGRRYPTF